MILTIAHTKGGVGKSTLAWHIIFMLISLGKSVRAVDLDFQQTTYLLNLVRMTTNLEHIEVEQPENISELQELFENYTEDVLVVDIGGFDTDINRMAISWADKILVPISNSVTEVLGFKTFEAILKEIDNHFINMVLNNIHPLTKNFDEITEAIGDNENIKLLDSVIRTRKIYKETMGEGKSIADTKDKVAKDEIKRLCNELISD